MPYAGGAPARRSAGRASAPRPSSGDDRARRAGVVAECEPRVLGLHGGGRRRDVIAEAAVDDRLGRPERRERLAAFVEVVELPSHELRKHAASPVGGHDPDPGDAGARRDPPGIVISNPIDAVIPTGAPSSYAPNTRSAGISGRKRSKSTSRSSSANATLPASSVARRVSSVGLRYSRATAEEATTRSSRAGRIRA